VMVVGWQNSTESYLNFLRCQHKSLGAVAPGNNL
jgi:hypothetical protein